MVTSTATLATSDPRVPGHSIVDWAIDLLGALKKPVTPTNVQAFTIWANQESGGYKPGNPVGLNNPLNTTESALGFSASGGAQGNIKGFSTYAQGIAAQAYNLTHTTGAGYENILSALSAGNDPNAVLAAINGSRFGTHGLPTNVAPATTIAPHNANGTVVNVGTQTASLGSAAGDAFGTLVSPFLNSFGIAGDALKGASGALGAVETFTTVLIKVFSDWRFIAEVIGGSIVVFIGVRLIVADTTGRPIVPRPPSGAAAAAAPVALAAAA